MRDDRNELMQITPQEFAMPTATDHSRHWLNQSLSPALGDDPFMRFITAWIAFNALYAEMSQTVDGDLNQVREFANDPELVSAHQHLLKHPDLPDYSEAVDVLGASGVLNLKTGRRRTIAARKSLLDVLGCIYQVRCNCFHGGKRMDDDRDRRLVRASFVIIVNLLTFYASGHIRGGWHQLLSSVRRA
jgi:hypothetical protein